MNVLHHVVSLSVIQGHLLNLQMSTASQSKGLLATLRPRVCSSPHVFIKSFTRPALICSEEGTPGAPRRGGVPVYTPKNPATIPLSFYKVIVYPPEKFKYFPWTKGEPFKVCIASNPLAKLHLIFVEIPDMLLKAVSLNPGVYMCRCMYYIKCHIYLI